MVLNSSGTARAYGCLSTSFSRLEREIRRRGALIKVFEFKGVYLAFILHFLYDFFYKITICRCAKMLHN